MIRFTTSTGSRYEVDTDNSKIRRLGGTAEPTPRQGVDGTWRTYQAISHIAPGYAVLVVWEVQAHLPSTLTSVVRTVEAT